MCIHGPAQVIPVPVGRILATGEYIAHGVDDSWLKRPFIGFLSPVGKLSVMPSDSASCRYAGSGLFAS